MTDILKVKRTNLMNKLESTITEEKYVEKIAPKLQYMDAVFTCQIAIMRLIEYFNFELPDEVSNNEPLRMLVIYLGGDTKNQNNASWQNTKQSLNMAIGHYCLLLRRGEPGTDLHESFSFNVDKYHDLIKRPEYLNAVQYLRDTVSDDKIRMYIISILKKTAARKK